MTRIEKLKAWIEQSKTLVIFTGAGISTPSGIPDFRSSNDDSFEKILNYGYMIDNKDEFREIYDKLVYSDPYMVLGDFMSYKKAQENVNEIYKDKYRFTKIELINTMHSYIFSSDRSINEYAKNIWEISKLD